MANKKLIRDLETIAYFGHCPDLGFVRDIVKRSLEEIEHLESKLEQLELEAARPEGNEDW